LIVSRVFDHAFHLSPVALTVYIPGLHTAQTIELVIRAINSLLSIPGWSDQLPRLHLDATSSLSDRGTGVIQSIPCLRFII